MHERLHDRIEPAFFEAVHRPSADLESLDGTVQRVFAALARHLLSEEQLFHAFMGQAALDPVIKEAGQRRDLQRRQAVVDVLLAQKSEIKRRDPEAAAHMAFTIAMSILRCRLIDGPKSVTQGCFSDEQLVFEIVGAVLAYLKSEDHRDGAGRSQ